MTEEQKPPRIAPRVKAAPKPRQVYWCDLPEDARLPEFWKRRPVLILSAKAKLHGCVTVVPLSSKAQPDNPHAHAFQSVLAGETLSWAICDHILTLSVSRLIPPSRQIPRIDEGDFQDILRLVHGMIPQPRAGH